MPATPAVRPFRFAPLLALLAAGAALAQPPQLPQPPQPPPAALTPGVVHPEVAPAVDPAQTYALYLPTNFAADRRWPVLLIFDPRGRGPLAAELFRPAAEEFGWILAASNRTRSDDPRADNQGAINALLTDVTTRLPVDERRLSAAGFSGGAVLAWTVGVLGGDLAGVIAVGGRPAPEHAARQPGFALFAAAGDEDFNYLPTLELVEQAAAAGVPHRFASFPGDHTWFPPALARRAVAWLELRAAEAGHATLAAPRLAALLAEETAAAEALAAAGDPIAAARAFRDLAAGFRFAADVGAAERRAAAIEAEPAYARARREEKADRKYEEQARRRLMDAAALLHAELPPPAGRVAAALGLADLKRRQAEGGHRGAAATRALATAHVQLSVYLGGAWLAAGDLRRALPAYLVATEARPDEPFAWYNRACVEARLGRLDDALASLEKSLAAGFAAAGQMRDDPDLAALAGDPRFARLLARAEAGAPPG